ncbi:PP2C family protein-serine/threonine phosphatase [Blastococcus sp. PRF04-17]|uniref:PP2C family protein-serine/threonine phosphatase n=1 Tax=Blastococcus sp. PRF04-17 TaxID=2933797 RepID=UPI001FF530D3|nr:PP2C family protein-serine/threonine phosphatase [Blastococcus sp. PRF04-17]UOY01660.1 serine/threonine-protein phosphatase [Blastococcus sp. PRF04-17]
MPSTDESDRLPAGFRSGAEGLPTVESMGEALLGRLLDRAHLIPADLVGPLVAQEARAAGAMEIGIFLQDYDQVHLQPLSGRGLSGRRVPIDESVVGRAFTTDSLVEEPQPDASVRLYLPMLDGSDRVGVLMLRLPRVNDGDRRLAQRLAGLVADLIVTKDAYTDVFARLRTARPMSLAAQLQWSALPPLAMTTPFVDLAGVLEPAYEVGGDAFDYALDGHVLHLGVFDAMGHGLDAATMSTVALAAYRHGRRRNAGLEELYTAMDDVVAQAFPGQFATAQIGMLDVESGELAWVNAGHPAPLWVRDGRVIGELECSASRPIGLGGSAPTIQSAKLEQGDRVLLFTDGVVEERLEGGEQFGEARLEGLLEDTATEGLAAAETVRRLSHALMAARSGRTSDDASLLLVEWKRPPREDELNPEIPEAAPTSEGR